MVPNCLLREYFVRHGHAEFVTEWDGEKEKDIGSVFEYIQLLDDRERDEIESGLHSVSDLASDAGLTALFQAARDYGLPDLVNEAAEELGIWGRTMWIWLHYPGIFDKGQILFQIDQMSFWRKRTDLPSNDSPDTSDPAIENLKEEISDLLREQGRGKDCTVDWLKRGDVFYFFAYPDDFVSSVLVHDKEGHLAPKSIRTTLSIVFAYDPKHSSLELFAKGLHKPVKEHLEKIFAGTILRWKLNDYDPDAAYELDRLKYAFDGLKVEPADRVSVRIRKLRLSSLVDGREVEIKIDDADPNDTIGKAIQEVIQVEEKPLDQWRVTRACFCFIFHPLDGRKHGRQSFDIGYPRSCSLRNARPERVELIQKYLTEWDIDLAKPPKYAAVSVGECDASFSGLRDDPLEE
ncbi:hypothetical protein [Bremerella sp. P1]|uniref:hypothetical protein n=1 Tax=Bremerella sp. P1 TaxID=3026424 RepID=UPI002368C1C7|nr:hypothetical protein [Bremerella sp. P1]WDI41476.1 hypothetical protein PSR63_23705 [Bremerella sp. P1]